MASAAAISPWSVTPTLAHSRKPDSWKESSRAHTMSALSPSSLPPITPPSSSPPPPPPPHRAAASSSDLRPPGAPAPRADCQDDSDVEDTDTEETTGQAV